MEHKKRMAGEYSIIQSFHIGDREVVLADCTLLSSEDDLNGKVIVIKADVLRREYRTAQHQLKLCVGGFGASPHSRGSAVFCQDLCSGQTSRFERRDILGTVKPEMLPAWAKQKLDEMQISRSKPGKEQER